MKRKSILTFLLCLAISTALVGCKKESADELASGESAIVEEQSQAINLTGVEAGTILDNATLVSYANSLSGRSDIISVVCNTETETNISEVVLSEGINSITLQYTTSSGETGETILVYEAYATTTIEDSAEEVVEEEVVEEVEEDLDIPIEDRFKFILTEGTESFTDEKFKSNTELESGTLVNISDIASTLSMYEPMANMEERTISNKYRDVDGTIEYEYDDDNYTAVIKNNIYTIDEYVYFAIESESALEGIYFGFKLTEEAIEEPEVMNDLCNELFSTIEDYYTVEWNYDSLIVEDNEEESTETSSTTTITTTTTTETLTSVVEDSYQGKHPELFVWPEPTITASRWDYRYTDSTAFKGVITMPDGKVIPELQQNQEGYQYDLNPSSAGVISNTSNGNSPTSSTTTISEAVIKSGSKAFRVNDYSVENIRVNVEESGSNRIVLEQNGDKFYVTTITSADWLKYANTDYYAGDLSQFEVKPIESLEIGAGPLKTTIVGRDASFLDSTGTEVTRQYMYGIDCGTDFIIIVGDDLPSRGNTTLYSIAKWCLEPIEVE